MAPQSDESPHWEPITADEARALGWKPQPHGLGNVTRACDEWLLTSQDQKAYLRLTLRWMQERFDAEWKDIMHAPGYEDGPEPYDVFEGRLGMSPGDWEWMTLAGVIRDAVTAYEVYVVKACRELLYSHGLDFKLPVHRQFAAAKELCELFALTIRPKQVNEVFELRNILTHQRGELRTQQERERYSEEGNVWGRLAHLTEETVLAHIDTLQASVDELDPVLWAYSWGQQVAPPLLVQGKGDDSN